MKKVKLPKWAKRIEVWLAFALLVGGVYAALANTIPNFPRWTWFSEHTALVNVHEDDIDAVELAHETDNLVLAGEIKANTIRILEDSVSFYQREGRALRAESRFLKRKGDHDPRLQKDLEENAVKLKNAKDILKAKRGQ